VCGGGARVGDVQIGEFDVSQREGMARCVGRLLTGGSEGWGRYSDHAMVQLWEGRVSGDYGIWC
jgi:hypothetical protein